jgi:hypothetical protein
MAGQAPSINFYSNEPTTHHQQEKEENKFRVHHITLSTPHHLSGRVPGKFGLRKYLAPSIN